MPKVTALVHELATFEGIEGCALVDADTGMAWHYAGSWPNIEHIGEAAIEFWRIQDRLAGQLAALGGLQSAAYSFSNRVVALFPCSNEPRLVLVCVAVKGPVAWQKWSPKVAELRAALAQGATLNNTGMNAGVNTGDSTGQNTKISVN
jgi:hypothetical protein